MSQTKRGRRRGPAKAKSSDGSSHPGAEQEARPATGSREWGPAVLGADSFLDLGRKECGDGPLEDISLALNALAPGQSLEVRAADADVGVALVAWCRIAGHTLLARRAGRFLIRCERDGRERLGSAAPLAFISGAAHAGGNPATPAPEQEDAQRYGVPWTPTARLGWRVS